MLTETASTGTVVSNWRDQSKNGFIASGYGAAPGFVSKAVNGLPAIQLSETQRMSLSLNNNATLALGTNEYLLEIVVRWTTLASNLSAPFQMYVDSISNVMGPFTFLEDALGHALVIEKDASATVTLTSAHAMFGDSTFRLFGARRMGTGAAATVEERVNGAVEAMQTGSAAGLDLGGTNAVQIGPGNELEIAEIVLVNGPTSPDDLAHVESYLMSKYGFR